jgi:hypothetical protein
MSFKRDVVLMRKHSICRDATRIKKNENSPHHIGLTATPITAVGSSGLSAQ